MNLKELNSLPLFILMNVLFFLVIPVYRSYLSITRIMDTVERTLFLTAVFLAAMPVKTQLQDCPGQSDFQTLLSTLEPQYLSWPSHGHNYSDNSDCRWRLNASMTTQRVCMRVVNISIEGTGTCCSRLDYLFVYDGAEVPSHKMAELCGSNHDGRQLCSGTVNLQDTGNYLILHFHSDWSVSQGGFQLQFWATENNDSSNMMTTNAQISTTPSFMLSPTPNVTSLSFTVHYDVIHLNCISQGIEKLESSLVPKTLEYTLHNETAYQENLNCFWKLQAPVDSGRVCLRVISLNIEDSLMNCSREDYLLVYDGADAPSHKLTELFGKNHDGRDLCSATVNSQDAGDFLTLHFHSDLTIGKQGFQLLFWTRNQTSDASSIQSITSPSVEVTSSADQSTSPEVSLSSPIYTTVEYETITLACNNTGNLTSGSSIKILRSPGYGQEGYRNKTECRWWLHAPSRSERVCLKVLTLDLDASLINCIWQDYIEIFDGREDSTVSLARLCLTNHTGEVLCSGSKNSIVTDTLILFFKSSDGNKSGKGFTLEFSTLVSTSTSMSKTTTSFSTQNTTASLSTPKTTPSQTTSTSTSIPTISMTASLSTPISSSSLPTTNTTVSLSTESIEASFQTTNSRPAASTQNTEASVSIPETTTYLSESTTNSLSTPNIINSSSAPASYLPGDTHTISETTTTVEWPSPSSKPHQAVLYGSIAGGVVGAVLILTIVVKVIRIAYKKDSFTSKSNYHEMTAL